LYPRFFPFTIDLETYKDDNDNSVVYCGAALAGSKDNMYVIYGENPNKIIFDLFNTIFSGEMKKKTKK
jgi:hypothetical protein